MTKRDNTCQGMKVGRGLAWMHQYEDSKTTLKRSKKNQLQLPENSTDKIMINRTIIRKQKWEEKQLY